MKILAISDMESKYLWDYYEKSRLEGIDLIISCGDLSPEYLSFLVTMSNVPVLYVHGNHDVKYENRPPEGCVCIEDKIYVHEGVRILGLGGSMRYNPEVNHQYTEMEMKKRVFRLFGQLFFRRGFDILVTHSPTYEINDGTDLPHRGFKIFRKLMDWYKPKYHLHGHVHMTYGRQHKRYDVYKDTKIINAYERCIIEYEV
ncbi:MAG: metallophosphoesterase family protein [Schaedlerella sp.]|nr:metallophosphoesterase family protein [Schaedlerella sp.]